MIPKTTQPGPGGAPKRSHHKRKDIPSNTPETPVNADRLKSPSLQKDGLPIHAYAIRPDEYDVSTWQLPHHTSSVIQDAESPVDWPLAEKAVLLLSMAGDEGRRISADPELIIEAARHIAGHFRAAGRSLPVALCVLI